MKRGRIDLERLSTIGRAVRLVWRSGPKLTAVNGIFIVMQGALPLLQLYLLKLVVDQISASVSAADKEAAFVQTLLIVAIAGGVFLLGMLITAVTNLLRRVQADVVSDYMHGVIHAKAIQLDLEYYENSDYYDLLHRTKQEAPYRPTQILGGLLQTGQSAISLAGVIALLFAFHWAIPAALLLAAFPGALVRLRFAGHMHKWMLRRAALDRESSYQHQLLMDELYVKEFRLFNLGPLFRERFQKIRARLRREKIDIMVKQSAGEVVIAIGGTLAVFGSIAFIARHTIFGALSIGSLVMYVGAFQRGQTFLQNLLGGAVGLYESSLFLSLLNDFLGLEERVRVPAVPREVPSPMKKGVAFDGVSFSYPSGGGLVLKDVSLTIAPGEVIGLVGENGSGKTTLIKLLCRLYDPSEGAVTLDGIDFREFDPVVLRRQLSVVFQDYRRYYASMRENIWFGDVERSPDDERIVAAARDAGIDGKIAGFEKKYDTMLGKWLENGEELSIGQLQKLAVARALLRDAQIMVLDEPTSAMDAKAEYELFTRFREIARGRTVILISHRLSTLKMADRIYVMKDGRVLESGTHADLVSHGGTYADLFETQARGYRQDESETNLASRHAHEEAR